MRWQTLVGLLLIGGSAWIGRDLMEDGKNPWPAYAVPQASCGTDLSGIHEGAAIKFRYPGGWRVSEQNDPRNGIVETFLTPAGGRETTLFIREASFRSSVLTVPAPAAPPQALRDAPNSPGPAWPGESFRNAPAPDPHVALRLRDTDQALTFDERRHGNAYLTRLDEGPQQVSFSWMAFVWDNEGRMTAVSGPKLTHSNWPNKRRRAREINCAFWEVLKTIEPK